MSKKVKRIFRAEGRPTVYRAAYAEQARKLCLLGYTDIELADFFGISEQTLCVWKRKHPKLVGSIKAGKAMQDAEVAASLLHRALGYSHKAVKILQHEGESYEHAYTEHYPPDTTAAMFWLRNRQPARWQEKTKIEGTGDGGAVLIQTVMARTREIAKLKTGNPT